MSRGRAAVANQMPALVVLALTAAGLFWVSRRNWREGLFLVAAGCLAGAVLRLVLPTRRAGLLAVRGRLLDVAVLGGLGAVVLLLTAVVPLPRG